MNSRLSELQAAFLRAKLPKLDEWNTRRAKLATQYRNELRDLSALTLPHVAPWAEPVWHLFVVRTPQRDALQKHLTAAGVGTQIHYPVPPHLSHAYAGAGWKHGDFPLAERFASEVLSLPIGPHLSSAQVDRVCDSVKRFFASQ